MSVIRQWLGPQLRAMADQRPREPTDLPCRTYPFRGPKTYHRQSREFLLKRKRHHQ